MSVHTEQLYTQLIALSDAGKPREAAQQILALTDVNTQIQALKHIAHHIEHDMVFAENLDFGSDFFLKLMYARENASVLAGHFNRSLDIAGTRAGFFARALTRSNRLALILADPTRSGSIDPESAEYRSKTSHDRLIRLNQVIAGVLNELTADDKIYATAEYPAVQALSSVKVSFGGVESLTPQTLNDLLVPFIQAIAELHSAIDRVTEEEGRDIKITAIKYKDAALEVTLLSDSGLTTALSILREPVFRQYRREFLLKREALSHDKTKIPALLSDTAAHIVKNIVHQIFHLPDPVDSGNLDKLTITQQMRSLKLDIQQKTLTSQLLHPVETALGSPLEILDITFIEPA